MTPLRTRYLLGTVFAVISAACSTTDAKMPAASDGVFLARSTRIEGEAYPYQVFLPAGYEPSRRWPVLLALHSAREYGSDGVRQLEGSIGPWIRQGRATWPTIVVFPQFPRPIYPANLVNFSHLAERVAIAALDSVSREFAVDSDRVYLTGASFGGTTALTMAAREPDRFAAVVPLAGGKCDPCIMDATGAAAGEVLSVVAQRLRRVPIWLFHGGSDDVVDVHQSRDIDAALRQVGAPVRFSELPGVGHGLQPKVYTNPELLPWLLAQRRRGRTEPVRSP